MARPYPLRGDDGQVRWWACGICHHVGSTGLSGHHVSAQQSQWSQELAERCCRCHQCHAELDIAPRAWSGRCEDCHRKWEAQRAAEEAAELAKAEAAEVAVQGADETERWAFLLGTPPEPGAKDHRQFVEVAVTEVLAGIYYYATCVVDGRGYSYQRRGDYEDAVAGLQAEVVQGTAVLATPLTPTLRAEEIARRKAEVPHDG